MFVTMSNSFKLFSWNVGGAGGKAFARSLKLALQLHRPDFVILLEPQVSGEVANRVCDRMGFSDVARVEANGRSGGVWVFWNGGSFTVHIASAGPQHLSLMVEKPNSPNWLLTAVYASPRQQEQKLLWNFLVNQSKEVACPWILTGDFNAILMPEEKSGAPTAATLQRCRRFSDWINLAELVDLGFSGPAFTWSRGHETSSYKASRLDRSLCNLAWNEAFPSTSVIHLPRLSSDHNPILTMVLPQGVPSQLPRKFKFEAAWLTHDSFNDLLTSSWNTQVALPQALQDFASKLQDWNCSVFGNVHHRKMRLLARTGGIEKRLAIAFCPGLAKLHSKLGAELEKTLEQEELLWFQRAREKWVKFGECNTAYFHQIAKIRRRANKIACLKNDNGDWIHDMQELKTLVFNFYIDLYTQEGDQYVDHMPKGAFPRPNQSEWLALLRPFTILDIHRAIFDMKPLQAPGPDGFQAIFFQKAWNVVGKALTDMALSFFENGSLPEEVSSSTVVLIPKGENPESVSQLRPISLNNVNLKAITKAMTSRLKPLMRKLISPRQSSFIPGRQTSDNILIVQEVLHSLKKRQGKKGGIVVKIDLEKAYDRLRWDFLRDTLIEVGLPSSWIHCIMYCVEHNHMRIFWNGELSHPITPSRGVRQGDPLSPYLFVLCMERLSHRIDQAVRDKSWKPIKLSANGPALTHLFFADDLILFAEAGRSQVRIIKQCLEEFCESSGQRVNFTKSSMFVSPNVREETAQLLSTRASIPLTKDLGRYLGVQTIHGKVTRSRYQALILRIKKKLAPWKARRLSLAARLTVVRSVSSSIPIYSMHTEQLPVNVCNSIDKINRDFVWGKEEDQGRLHLVAWEKLLEPKWQGGAGLQSLRQANLSLLAKTGWRLLTEKDNLLAQIMKDKYGRRRNGLEMLRPSQGSSFAWRSMTKASDLLKRGLAWNIHNGKGTNFWKDVWCLQVPLIDVAVQPIPEEMLADPVASYVDEDGRWDVDRLKTWLTEEALNKVTAVAVDPLSTTEDTLFWSAAENGLFSAKSAYLMAYPRQLVHNESFWKKIWRLHVPERVCCFTWLVALGKIATNVLRFSRKCADSPDCHRCNGIPETILHILRDCPPAVFFWHKQVPQAEHHNFFSASAEDWIKSNINKEAEMESGMAWNEFFASSIWLLWKNRCTACFKGVGATLTAPSLANSIFHKTTLWHTAWKSDISTQLFCSPVVPRVIANIRWVAPPSGWMKLNVDGASAGNP
ncbi:unnamed protein product [Linum trigynum]|uniref:Reverse transcriptase domain-containing protein n=2 Tax=Linum trigynum TaxID=586398 RepID=A0AAV2CG44_9ROSI